MSFKDKAKKMLYSITTVFKEKNIIPVIVEKEQSKILDGKVALIIGGTGGIGFSIAKKFNECGCKVILAGTNEEKLKKNSAEVNQSKTIVIDFKDIDRFKNKIKDSSDIFGRIDIVVCSAGVHTDFPGFEWSKVSEKDYDYVMDINLKGTYFFIQETAKYMIENKIKGNILVISSYRALEPAWSPYRLSKLGINGIVKGFAQQLLPYGIVVNAIGPGSTATSMQQSTIKGSIFSSDSIIERMALPEEIAEFAKNMVSGAGNLIVGQTVYLSAGRGIVDIR